MTAKPDYPYGQTWFEGYPSGRFTNTIYDVPADAGDPGQLAGQG
jgi:hypothetical protein